MAALGMSIGIMARSDSRLHEVAEEIGTGTVLPLVADIADAAAVDDAVSSMTEHYGAIDVLVHTAAISEGSVELLSLSDEQIDEVTRVNVRGSIVVARSVARRMTQRRAGRIVNVASVAAHQAMAGRNVYGTTKGALVQLTRQLAVELGPSGIAVNSVSPGQTPTQITLVGDPPGKAPRAKSATEGEAGLDRIPLRRRGDVDDYVGPILFLASELAGYVTGVDLVVDGGVSALR